MLAAPTADARRSTPDCDDPELVQFFRETGEMMKSGSAHGAASVHAVMLATSTGEFHVQPWEDRPHMFMLLSLRGSEAADHAWGRGQGPEGLPRRPIDTDGPLAEGITAPVSTPPRSPRVAWGKTGGRE